MGTLLTTLRDIVGENHVLDASRVAERSRHVWSSEPLQALALVRPATTSEVSKVLKACRAAGQVVVTHGGRTGLADGEHSTRQDLIVSLERMQRIDAVDEVSQTITVDAGALLEAVQRTANEAGLQLGLDLGARGSCTIGGNIATNAGGLSVLRYGMMREQVLGLEVVLADGTVVSSMNRMLKNNAGYDLKQLFIGSEGTLGIVTRAVLRLRPATPSRCTALLAHEQFANVTDCLAQLRAKLGAELNAFEVLWHAFYELNTNPEYPGTERPPLGAHPYYTLVEMRGAHQARDTERFEAALGDLLKSGCISDAVLPASEAERQRIWNLRENVETVRGHHPVFVYDISLPIADMQHWLDSLHPQLRVLWPNVIVYTYGHLADGNLHLQIAPFPERYQHSKQACARDHTSAEQKHLPPEAVSELEATSDRIVYQTLSQFSGSISAEHGIGLKKKAFLHLSRTTEEIQLMQTFKHALDPDGLLNPGKILPGSSRAPSNG